MIWYGKLIGAILGWMLLRHPAGAVLGALVGHAFDAGWFRQRRADTPPPPPSSRPAPSAQEDYRILGISEQSSDEELERAYRKLMSQYHPDRVSGAADEFRELAEQRTRSINAAYDRIRTRRQAASQPPRR